MYPRRTPRTEIRILTNFELQAECNRLLHLLSKESQSMEVVLEVIPFIAARQIIQIIRRLEKCGYAVEVECFDPLPGDTQRVWRFTREGSVRLFVTRCGPGPSEISEPPIQPLTPDQVRAFLDEKRKSEQGTLRGQQVPHVLTKKHRQKVWWARNAQAVTWHLQQLRTAAALTVVEIQGLSAPSPIPRRFNAGHIPSRPRTNDAE